MQNILRVAAAVPHLSLGNVEKNVEAHLAKLREAKANHAALVVFPAMSLTGATCGDLLYQQTLLNAAQKGLDRLMAEMPEGVAAVVGLPLRREGRLVHGQTVVTRDGAWDGAEVYASQDGVTFSLEEVGAELTLCPSAEQELVGRRARRRQHMEDISLRDLTACVYVGAGWGESTADGLYSGHSIVAACGHILAENANFIDDDYLLYADIDLDILRAERLRAGAEEPEADVAIPVNLLLPEEEPVRMHINKLPFIPEEKAAREQRCREIFEMQGYALARRLQITGGKAVVGISGGLDSTLALLAACRAVDILHLPRTNILGVTMPCFGTTDRTYQSALDLMAALGVTQKEVRIHESVRQHFRDIGHDESLRDVTYENAQARERTQVLMDLSNQFGGIVLGTGDLSEIALGWCTYNGDHMSMYGVNCGIPKTLVRFVTRVVSGMDEFAAARAVLERILDTPISPELLPPDEKGNIAQQTEELVGPYALHDFFLYYAVRYGLAPGKIFDLCVEAFRGDFDRETIKKWLKNFYRRFFTQQFKRNCSPDGVGVGLVGLSPRGSWAMPSDAQSAVWLAACDEL